MKRSIVSKIPERRNESSQDALEVLREVLEREERGKSHTMEFSECDCTPCSLRAAIAAWEKERAGFEALMPHVDTIKELAALRVEVQAVEEECSQLCHEAPCPDLCFEPDLCSTFRKIRDRLRKARTGRSAKEV